MALIDEALDNHDQKAFTKYTTQLQILNHEETE
ncbi:IDEAL domain-containing protein [Planococcus halocryophilus]|nr:IDEAL domain-containing protein [Planococcus halocryophilus]